MAWAAHGARVDEPYFVIQSRVEGGDQVCFYAEKVLERQGASGYVSRSVGPFATAEDAGLIADWLNAEPRLV